MNGWVIDSDGIQGVRGQYVWRADEILTLSSVASGASAFADAFAAKETTSQFSEFTEERSDRRYSVKLTVIFRQLEEVLGFAPSVSFAYENWSSNIDAFDFDRFEFGASADILAWSF